MKLSKKQAIMTVAIGIFACAGAPLAYAGWGNVFDPKRFDQNVLIYAKKVDEYNIQSKMYANLLIACARLAGVDTANNTTIKALEDYRDGKTQIDKNLEYLNSLNGKYEDLFKPGNSNQSWDEKVPELTDIMKKKNAKDLEDIDKGEKAQSNLQKSLHVLMKLKSDGTLGELQKGNYLEGLSVTEKLAKINGNMQKFQQYVADEDLKYKEEVLEQVQNAKEGHVIAYDPFHPDDFDNISQPTATEKHDTFGNTDTSTHDLGFKKF